ncbi:MAG: VanZ family protein [Lachnospiraceae bacterium]|nr:VanZ family protein [Lachnospiraceae bacterium]
MFQISFWQFFLLITAAWILVRAVCMIRDHKADMAHEAKLLLVYVCLVVIARIVYFPWHHVDGKIGLLTFNVHRLLPPNVNLIPLIHLGNVYDGWEMNIIGNVLMFVPVGIVWPVCFHKLDGIVKTVLAGALLSVLIEISQLLFYQRCSDVDDVLLNTTGVLIGAVLFFTIRKASQKRPKQAPDQ